MPKPQTEGQKLLACVTSNSEAIAKLASAAGVSRDVANAAYGFDNDTANDVRDAKAIAVALTAMKPTFFQSVKGSLFDISGTLESQAKAAVAGLHLPKDEAVKVLDAAVKLNAGKQPKIIERC